MIRLIVVAIILVGFLVFSYPVLLKEKKAAKEDPKAQQEHTQGIVRWILGLLFQATGSKLDVKGLERIPDEAVLYVGNHQSYFDILAGYMTVPGLTGFVAKKEMEAWPLVPQWMELINCLFLDRKDMKQGLKTILQGIEKVRDGVSVWIFPEGTRNENEDSLELMPFHEGSLKIAEKSGCPVVPVAITGTPDIFEKHFPWIRPSHVTIEYGEPFYIKELPAEYRKRPGAYTRERIIEMLKREQEARRA